MAFAGTFHVIERWSRDGLGCDWKLSKLRERAARAELSSLAFVALICLVLLKSAGRSNVPQSS